MVKSFNRPAKNSFLDNASGFASSFGASPLDSFSSLSSDRASILTVSDGEVTLDVDHYGEPLKQVGRHWYDTDTHVHKGHRFLGVMRTACFHIVFRYSLV